jgi:hypothetical protein
VGNFQAKPYRVTLGIIDTRNPGPAMTHVIRTVAYDAMDAGIQAGMEASRLGLLTPETIESGLKIEIHNVQPDSPPFSEEGLKGADRGALGERIAQFLFINGY